jgi:hypothetical protein
MADETGTEVLEGDFQDSDFGEMDELEDVRIEGSLEPDERAFYSDRIDRISDSKIVGRFGNSGGRFQADIEDTEITGDIDADDLLRGAENTIARGGHITANGALVGANNSALIGDRVQVTTGELVGESTFRNNYGNVVAARDLELGPTNLDKLGWSLGEFRPGQLLSGRRSMAESVIESFINPIMYFAEANVEVPDAEDVNAITEGEPQNDQVTGYHGDWNQLAEYLQDEVPEGGFRGFDVFNMPDSFGSFDEFREFVEDVQDKYDEVGDDVGMARTRINNLDLPPLEGSNQEIYDRLANFRDLSDTDGEVSFWAVNDPERQDMDLKLTANRRSRSGTFKFRGDEEELASKIEELPLDSKELIYSLGMFDFDDIETAEDLEYEMKARDFMGSELADAYEFVKEFEDVLDIELPDDNRETYGLLRDFQENYKFWLARENKELKKHLEGSRSTNWEIELDGDSLDERYEQLAELEEEVKDRARERWGLDDEAMEIIEEGNTTYLLKNLGEVEDGGILGYARKKLGSGGVERFLKEFSGGNPERALEPGFEQTYFTDGHEAVESEEEAAEAAYEEGVDLLERIAREQGNFEVDHPEIRELEDELDEVIDRISNSDGRPPQELIERKNQLKSEIPEKRREKAFEELGLEYSQDADYSDLDPLEVRQVLDQLGQEYLENCKAEQEAQEVAQHIDVSGDVGNGYVEFQVYDMDVTDLPDDDRHVPCSFPGGSMEHEFLNYMRDPGTQIALLEAGDDNGAVISHQVEYDGQDHLLVHSVESDDGITSRNDISRAIRDHIEDYAEEAGMDGVIYSTGTHNTAAQEFIDGALAEDDDFEEQTYEVEKKGMDDVYLDFRLPEVEGYMQEL